MRAIHFVLCAALAIAPTAAFAQAGYPDRPIRLIVAFAPGSPTDLVARVVGQGLSEALGKPVVVENRPGAGGIIASQVAKKANPDGYTVLVTSVSFAINVSLANPGYASSGAGTSPHLNMEQLFRVRNKVDITHVPMGPPQAVNAVAGLQVPVAATAMATAVPTVKSGRIRAVAVTSAARSAILPDVATVAESGFPGFRDHTWFSFFAPAGAPPAIVTKLNAEINRILRLPESKARLDTLSLEFAPKTPAEFAASLKAEVANYAKMVQDAGLKAD